MLLARHLSCGILTTVHVYERAYFELELSLAQCHHWTNRCFHLVVQLQGPLFESNFAIR